MKKFPDFFKMGKIRVEYGASYAENASKNEKIGVCRGGARRKREDHARKQRPRKRCTLSWRGKRNESGAAVSSSAARDRAALAKSTERDRASRTESPESKHTPDAKKRSTPNPPENEWRVDTSSDKNGTNYGTYSAGMLTSGAGEARNRNPLRQDRASPSPLHLYFRSAAPFVLPFR